MSPIKARSASAVTRSSATTTGATGTGGGVAAAAYAPKSMTAAKVTLACNHLPSPMCQSAAFADKVETNRFYPACSRKSNPGSALIGGLDQRMSVSHPLRTFNWCSLSAQNSLKQPQENIIPLPRPRAHRGPATARGPLRRLRAAAVKNRASDRPATIGGTRSRAHPSRFGLVARRPRSDPGSLACFLQRFRGLTATAPARCRVSDPSCTVHAELFSRP